MTFGCFALFSLSVRSLLLAFGSFDCSEPLLGRSWPLLGRSWQLFGRSWALLGRSWGALGRSWASLGKLLAALGPLLAALGPLLGRSGALLGSSWRSLGHAWDTLDDFRRPKLAQNVLQDAFGNDLRAKTRIYKKYCKTQGKTHIFDPKMAPECRRMAPRSFQEPSCPLLVALGPLLSRA